MARKKQDADNARDIEDCIALAKAINDLAKQSYDAKSTASYDDPLSLAIADLSKLIQRTLSRLNLRMFAQEQMFEEHEPNRSHGPQARRED